MLLYLFIFITIYFSISIFLTSQFILGKFSVLFLIHPASRPVVHFVFQSWLSDLVLSNLSPNMTLLVFQSNLVYHSYPQFYGIRLPQSLSALTNLYFSATLMWPSGLTPLLKQDSDRLRGSKCNYACCKGSILMLHRIKRCSLGIIFLFKNFSNVMQVIWAINLCILYKYRKIQIYFAENVEKKKKNLLLNKRVLSAETNIAICNMLCFKIIFEWNSGSLYYKHNFVSELLSTWTKIV